MDYKKYVNAEWKEKHTDGIYLHAYSGKEIKIREVPTLLIGIGGSGIEALSTLKRKLESIYNPDNLTELEYLFIDTDQIPESADIKRKDSIIIQSTDTVTLLRERDAKNGLMPDEIKEWLDPNISPFKVMNGAAGIRQAGRFILFLNIQHVYKVLESKINKLKMSNHDLTVERIEAYIFTGIGGGTGSGMFIDICYLLRHIQDNIELNGFIIMPDVSCLKPGLRDVTKRNIMRNSFAALKELEYLMMLERYHEWFVQDYTGSIGQVKTQAPLFDYCYLIGAQQTGRRAISSEKEVYRRLSEYMISVLQEKYSFDVNSFKSNMAFAGGAKECYFEGYVAIGADAKYLAVDYYYSKWIKEVIDRLMTIIAQSDKAELEKEGFFREIVDNMKKWADETYLKKKEKLIYTGEMREADQIELRTEAAKSIIWEPFEHNLLFKELSNVYCGLHFDSLQELVNGFLDTHIKQALDRKLLNRKENEIKKSLIEKYFLTVFWEKFEPELKIFQERYNNMRIILNEIQVKCESYKDLRKDPTYFFSDEYFDSIRASDAYRESIEEAVRKIVSDCNINSRRWLGETDFNDPFIWLSDYIAQLLRECFDKSGCRSILQLLKSEQDGSQMRQIHLEQILNQLYESKQLWPTIGTNAKEYNSFEVIFVPSGNYIKYITDKWAEKINDNILISQTKIRERFSKLSFVSGYAMCSFEGLGEWEKEYILAQNKIGLHLYAANIKWEELPSPYYETRWKMNEQGLREEEKKRNDGYRKNFEKALDIKYIRKEEDMNRYYFYVNDEDEIITDEDEIITDEDGTITNKKIYIGDIITENMDLIKDMYVHMFTYREKMRQKLLKIEPDEGVNE